MTVQYSYNYNRTVIRGDSDRFRVTFTKNKTVNGIDTFEPIDITGWTVYFTVRPEVPSTDVRTDNDALIHKEGVLVDSTNGVAVIYVTAEETTKLDPGTYYYDIQYVRPLDEFGHHQVRSIRKAKYNIIGDITRDNSHVINGGNAYDFKDTNINDYVIISPPMEEGEIDPGFTPLLVLDPRTGYNGGYAKKETIMRLLDGGNAKSEPHTIEYKIKSPSFFDDEQDNADDGYEI